MWDYISREIAEASWQETWDAMTAQEQDEYLAAVEQERREAIKDDYFARAFESMRESESLV